MQAQRLLPVLMWNLMPLLSPKVAGAAGWAVVGALEGAAPEEAGEPGIVYVRVVCKPEAVGMDDMRYAFRFGNDKQVNGTNKLVRFDKLKIPPSFCYLSFILNLFKLFFQIRFLFSSLF